MVTTENFTRVNNDTNGNPRYVCHFLGLLTDKDENQVKENYRLTLQQNPLKKTGLLYDFASEKVRTIGGKKYRGKDFGGGIVFQSYNLENTVNKINELLK